MTRVDLTVMGAGIFGLACAYTALRRGASVRIIELVAVGAGSSGGLVGALSPHVPENWNPKKAFQLESLLMAPDWWAGVEAAAGVSPGYRRSGRLQPLTDAQAVNLAHQRAVGAADLWQGQAEWRVIAATGAAWEPATPTGYLVHDTLSARVHPQMACAALAAAVMALGGDLVIGIATPPTTGKVLWATGVAGLGALSQDLGRMIGGGVKGQALALRHSASNAQQLFVDGLHIVPHADGTVAIGSTSEKHFDDPTSTDDQLHTLHARAVAALPALAAAPIVARWAGVRPRAASRAPLLGAWPGRQGQFVANGGYKIGFGMAPKVAQVMADLILDGKDTIPAGFGF
jgi:glycine oxidase